VVACSFIMSGMRMFDIRDPHNPREIAYANFPTNATKPGEPASSFVMCAPAFVPERGEVWFADGNSGFYAMRVTNGVWPFTAATAASGRPAVLGQTSSRPQPAAPPAAQAAPAQLAVTGGSPPVVWAGALLALGLGLRRLVPRRHRARPA